MPSGGALIDVTVNGRKEPAIAQVGKSSLFYVLDRETGEPLLPGGGTPGSRRRRARRIRHPT